LFQKILEKGLCDHQLCLGGESCDIINQESNQANEKKFEFSRTLVMLQIKRLTDLFYQKLSFRFLALSFRLIQQGERKKLKNSPNVKNFLLVVLS